MKEDKWLESIIEKLDQEQEDLERRIEGDPHLSNLKMPENSYEDLMRRMKLKEYEEKKVRKHMSFPKKLLLTACLLLVLCLGMGIVSVGKKMYYTNLSTSQGIGGEGGLVTNEEYIYSDITSLEEAYELIEKELGIKALRLAYVEEGLKVEKIVLQPDLEEAVIRLTKEEELLTIYMRQKNEKTSIQYQPDGEVVSTIESFWLYEEVEIWETERGEDLGYSTQILYENTYYYLETSMDLKDFEKIISEIYFKSV